MVTHDVPVFRRVGQRGTGLSATIARSEHEISEIIDGLSEQEVGTIWSAFLKLLQCRCETEYLDDNSPNRSDTVCVLRGRDLEHFTYYTILNTYHLYVSHKGREQISINRKMVN